MKTLWVAFLAAILLVSGWGGARAASVHLNGANSSASKIKGCTGKGTVSFMFWGDKGEKAEQDADVRLAESACPGLHVNEIWDQGNYENDLATRLGSGNAPDVMQVDPIKRTAQYVHDGALAPLDKFVARDHLNLKKVYWNSCLPSTQYHGHVYGLLRDCGSQGILYYNKDMFDAKGVKYPTNNWTLSDLRAAAIKLSGTYSTKSDSESRLRFGFAFDGDDMPFGTLRAVWQFGGDWTTKDVKTCTLNSKASQAGLSWWRDLRYKYHGAPTAQQQTASGGPFDGFRKQSYAMGFFGPWALDYIFGKGPVSAQTPTTFRWGGVVTPKGPKNRAAAMGAAMETVYSGSKNKNAAWWLARFLTQGKGGALEAAYGIGIPGDKHLINDPRIVKTYGKSLLKVMMQTNKYGRSLYRPVQFDKFVDVVKKDLDPMWRNEASISSATSKACSDLQSQGLLQG